MCTVVILRRPGTDWPLLLAANRDEMADRPWLGPGRHWPNRPEVLAGLDQLGRGTWLGLNDAGLVAAVLNRINTLGPAPGRRSRGELPLVALAHRRARDAAAAIAALEPRDYRPFNMIFADADTAFWVRAAGDDGGEAVPTAIDVEEVPPGLSMVTAYDRNDLRSPRTRRYLPLFASAATPDPGRGDWIAWQALLARRDSDEGAGPGGGMTVVTPTGFGTVCSSLVALPQARSQAPIWSFAPGRPGTVEFAPVETRVAGG